MSLELIQKHLRRLRIFTMIATVTGVLIVFGFATFSIWQVRELHAQQEQLQELTYDLCSTLERAGILIQGTVEDPCER